MPSTINEIVQRAKTIPKNERKGLLCSIPEVELHRHLKELFGKMETNYLVEITHGADEFGKDLVIVKKDRFGTSVTGVVVKRGDVKGTTLGEVDEIKGKVKKAFSNKEEKTLEEIASQIEQAFANPSEVKAIFPKLPISEVLVVLAGDISSNARERLNKEVKGQFKVLDINWLVDSFTDYYPQVFYEGRIIDFVQQTIQSLEGKHSLLKRSKNLSDYFIEPMVVHSTSMLKFDAKSLDLKSDEKPIQFSELKSVLKTNAQIFLIGEPGSGKSGALAKLAIDMLRQAASKVHTDSQPKKHIEIPILVPSSEILNKRNAKELSAAYFGSDEIKDRFTIASLFVDGLDEVPAERRKEVIEQSQNIARQLDCSLVITSRRIDIIDIPQLGFEKYELLHLRYQQAIQLFERVVDNRASLKPLKVGLDRIKSQIPMIPLALMFLVDLVEDKGEIPASITELYDRYYDMALGRFDKEKGISALFDYLVKKKFLASLAFNQFYLHNRLEIQRSEFQEYVHEYARLYGWEGSNIEIFIREVERAGVLDIRDRVIYRHRSVLDYFVASHIFDKQAEFQNLDETISKIYFNHLWGEVAFFFVGLKREITASLLDKIFQHEPESSLQSIEKLLVGRMVQAGWHSPTDVKYSGLKRAIEYAPTLRKSIVDEARRDKVEIPEFLSDIVVMGISEASFNSGFVYKEVKALVEELKLDLTANGLFQRLLLIFSMRNFLNPVEYEQLANGILGEAEGLSIDEKVRFMLLIMVLRGNDKTAIGSIKRNLKKLARKHPGTFKKLLPDRRKQLVR